MFDLNDNKDVINFKKRLSETRKQKGFTQDTFAEELHFGDRSRIANWESKKSSTVLLLKDFATVCKLLDVDPNYLLGESNIESNNDDTISQVIGLSYSNVRLLRKKDYNNLFIDYLLSSSELHELINRIKQICYYGFISEAQETTFTPDALKKIKKAFDKFYHEVFPLDMNKDKFAVYLKEEMGWKPEVISINDFINASITDNEYNNILFGYPDFESQPDMQKYMILIQDIAETSYDYMLKRSIIEVSRHEITKVIDNIVSSFIDTEISKFKNKKRG